MEFLDLCRDRYSVRKFAPTPVEDEKIAKILEAGRLAPTARNLQSHRIFVLKSADAIATARAATPMAFDAPLILLVTYDKTKSFKGEKYGEVNFEGGEADAAIVTTMMMMEAQSLGVGSLWTRGWSRDHIREAFGLPEELVPMCMLDLGYPAPDCEPAPRHTQRLPLSETVKFL